MYIVRWLKENFSISFKSVLHPLPLQKLYVKMVFFVALYLRNKSKRTL